jgi:excisionase family DNA binding protein
MTLGSPLTRDEEHPESIERYEDEDLLAPSDAARIATRSVRTIRRAYSSGRLTAFRDRSGRGVRIRYADLRNWMLGEEISPSGVEGSETPIPARPAAASAGSHQQSLALLQAARRSRRSGRGSTSAVS